MIFSGHVVVLGSGEVAKVVDRSPNGENLYVTLVAFGASGGRLRKVPVSAVRFATAEEIAGSPFAREFHFPAPKENTE